MANNIPKPIDPKDDKSRTAFQRLLLSKQLYMHGLEHFQHIREEVEKLGLAGTVKWTMTAAAHEYHETLAIEKAISEDPKKREAWIMRQLELEHVDTALTEPTEPIEALVEE